MGENECFIIDWFHQYHGIEIIIGAEMQLHSWSGWQVIFFNFT